MESLPDPCYKVSVALYGHMGDGPFEVLLGLIVFLGLDLEHRDIAMSITKIRKQSNRLFVAVDGLLRFALFEIEVC